METRTFFKKYCLFLFSLVIVFVILLSFLLHLKEVSLNQNIDKKIDAIISSLKNTYPNIKDEEILDILNKPHNNSYLKEYGYDFNLNIFDEVNKTNKMYNIIIIGLLVVFVCGIILIFKKSYDNNDKEISEIIKMLERINHYDYTFELEEMQEDKLSILRNELYKTTIMLKESAKNSLNDKLSIKSALSDISHQIKTPLTSIIIMLDNIIEDKDIDPKVREEFLYSMKREILNINFLVQNILKLSKLDANAIQFKNEKCQISSLIEEAILNVSALGDLKNISIHKEIFTDKVIICDERWQVEAITNILKNAIEHSKENTSIDVICGSTNLYAYIKVIDNGCGLTKEEIKRIFERFYRSDKEYSDSVGIGLTLAKSIIEHNNGKIEVSSKKNSGTTFLIKYY